MSAPDVSVCIPTWQSAEFIERTLRCAREQTHAAIRILVSVDLGCDGTAEICKAVARQDSRIKVIVQSERLGWSQNCNALLDAVETEYFFFYFHDDIIEPGYVEALRAALLARPDAGSAQCDVQAFGLRDTFLAGTAYPGPAAERLIQYLVGPRGYPLRCLTRRMPPQERAGREDPLSDGLRFAAIPGDTFYAAAPYMLAVAAAGPMLHVAAPLYRRWFRPGMMTESWSTTPVDEVVAGLRESMRLCAAVIDRALDSAAERALTGFALTLMIMTQLRGQELRLRVPALIAPEAISPALGRQAVLPEGLESLDPAVQSWILRAQAKLQLIEARHAREQGDGETTLQKAALAAALDPTSALAQRLLAHCLLRSGQPLAALVAAHRASLADPALPGVEALIARCATMTSKRAEQPLARLLPEGREPAGLEAVLRAEARVHLAAGHAARLREDWQGARDKAGLAAALDPGLAPAQRLLGNCLVRSGQPQAALVAAHRARLVDQAHAGVAQLIARCHDHIRRMPRSPRATGGV
jgi:tetratricopeptide (TPR) repeat protein